MRCLAVPPRKHGNGIGTARNEAVSSLALILLFVFNSSNQPCLKQKKPQLLATVLLILIIGRFNFYFRISLAITIFCISEVPSPMVQSLLSR